MLWLNLSLKGSILSRVEIIQERTSIFLLFLRIDIICSLFNKHWIWYHFPETYFVLIVTIFGLCLSKHNWQRTSTVLMVFIFRPSWVVEMETWLLIYLKSFCLSVCSHENFLHFICFIVQFRISAQHDG